MEIVVGTRIMARATSQNVFLRKMVGAYELSFPLNLHILRGDTSHREASIVGARVAMQATSGEHQLGYARLDAPLHILLGTDESSASITFSLPLLPHQISSIEELRGEESLTFYLTLCGSGREDRYPRQVHDKWGIAVPRSRWIEMLREAAALDVLLIEIPMPVADLPPEWRKVRADLLEAQRHFHLGEFGACVVSCRKVVQETGQKLYGEQDWSGSRLDRLASGRRDMTKAQREEAVNAAIRHFTHPAAHAEGEGGDYYTRAEAKLVLSMAAAIVSRAVGG